MPQALHEYARRVLTLASLSGDAIEALESAWQCAVATQGSASEPPSFAEWLQAESVLDARGIQVLEYLARGYVTSQVAASTVDRARVEAMLGATSEQEQAAPAAVDADMVLRRGRRVLGLVIFDEIDFGAHGRAGFAYDQKNKNFVVLKALDASADSWIDEHMGAKQQTLPGLRTVGREPLRVAIYDWSEGVSLESFAARFAPLGARASLSFALEVANRLVAGGRGARSHGGLCAANVRIAADGSVQLLDWGLPGAPHGYLAPGIAAGTASEEADIYAIGALVFRILCGFEPRRPVDPVDANEQLSKMLRAGHDEGLVGFIERCMAFSAGDRFATLAEIIVTLGRMLHAGVVEGGDGVETPTPGDTSAEIEQGLNWLEDTDGGFPQSAEDVRRKRERACKTRERPEDVSTEATASALDEMRSELVQSFRKKSKSPSASAGAANAADAAARTDGDDSFLEIDDGDA